MIISNFDGRMANNIIQNIGLSILGKKLNLKVSRYKITSDIQKFNLNLWEEGRVLNKSPKSIYTDNDIDKLFDSNFKAESSIIYKGNFQDGEFLFKNKLTIKKMFCYEKQLPLKESSLIIMIRLGDVAHLAPPIDFYREAIKDMELKLGFGNNLEGFITSDSPSNPIVKKLAEEYSYKVILSDATETLKFASRFKNFILTGGSYNWLAAFLADAKNVIYPEYTYLWHGDIYSNFGWTKKKWRKYAPIRFFFLKNYFWKFDYLVLSLRKFKRIAKKIISSFT